MRFHARSLIRVLQSEEINPQRGIEVGVFRGHTSAALLKTFPELHLIMLDTWKAWDETSEYFRTTRIGKRGREEWEEYRREAITLTQDFCTRRAIFEGLSSDHDKYVDDGSLDFAFLDANHTYEAVKEDIALWGPKVRAGGIVSGHDYNGRMDRRGVWGVKRAVDEYVADGGLEIRTETGRLWWTRKP